MKDFVPLGTGNSRYLKSVENFKTLYPTYDAFVAALVAGTLPIDLNGVNEAGVAQRGTALNKPNLLTDEVASLFGFDSNAVPNDLFAWLGKYNQHWWRRKSLTSKTLYKQTYTKASDLYGEDMVRFRFTDLDGTDYIIYVADAISFNETTGELALVAPIRFVSSDAREYRYFQSENGGIVTYDHGTVVTDIIYVADEDKAGGSADEFYLGADGLQVCRSESYQVDTGEYSIVRANTSDAYPHSGQDEAGDFEYWYLGVPFDNAVTAPKFVVGTYTGTGNRGSSNQNTLTFDFKPKVVIISNGVTGTKIQMGFAVLVKGQPYAMSMTNAGYMECTASAITNTLMRHPVYATFNGNTVSWYTTTSAMGQMNEIGYTYSYVAFG